MLGEHGLSGKSGSRQEPRGITVRIAFRYFCPVLNFTNRQKIRQYCEPSAVATIECVEAELCHQLYGRDISRSVWFPFPFDYSLLPPRKRTRRKFGTRIHHQLYCPYDEQVTTRVKSRKQAIAISLSEALSKGAQVPARSRAKDAAVNLARKRKLMKQLLENEMSRTLEPLCPRDDHVMHFEAKGISWKELPTDKSPQTIASYHCDFEGCSVRFDNETGYFTVVLTPDQPYFIEEPGINLLQCPAHHAWLYRSASVNANERYQWRCGVDGCHYVHAQKMT